SEVRVIQGRDWIIRIQMVRQIKCFSPELHGLFLENLELPRESHVDRDDAGPLDILGGVTPYPVRRPQECRGIEPAIHTLVWKIRIGQDLIRAVHAESAPKRGVETGRHGEVADRKSV